MNGDALSRATLVALALFAAVALTACSPDDAGSASGNTSVNAATNVVPPSTPARNDPQQTIAAVAATPAPVAPANWSTTLDAPPPSNSSSNDTPSAILSAQASLAADSKQVTPVMHFAPDDNSN
ncbi:hypothetical protein N0A02_32495 [Paraburkholderia acidicola]|uniref:Lipoprotein n=1 Tax=Paraburkholderia acidicola TaxID=1912599 RepID=A0ABV1LZ03_9BURK